MASMATKPVTAGTSVSHPYTCNTCQVAYRNIDLQKGHMKSDWHRYNLKRRVASLPPISADIFTEKVLQARAVTTAETDKVHFERACEGCQKTYYSENAYQNHLSSQKHKAKVLSSDGEIRADDEATSVVSSSFSLGDPVPARRNSVDSDKAKVLSSDGEIRADDEATSVVSSSFSLGDPVPARRNSVDSDAKEEFNQVIEGFNRANIGFQEQRPSPVKRPSNPQQLNDVGKKEAQNGRESGNTTPVQSGEPSWTVNSCIFCNYSSPSVPLNVHHMERFHGMFIPEKTYLVNLDGLIEQLQHKVHHDHECIYCGKTSTTIFGVQTHMKDKGHCKIPFSTEQEQLRIGDFYDFRSTYSDQEGEDEESGSADEEDTNGGVKLGARRVAKVTGEDGQTIDAENSNGWETDSSASSLDSEDLTGVPAENHIHQYERLGKHPHHTSHDPRHRHQVDGWHSHAHKHAHAVFWDDFEMYLPSGKTVGHRSFNKYYRQNLHNYPTEEERAERQLIKGANEDDEADGEITSRAVRVQERGRAIVPRGAAGLIGVSDHKRQLAKKSEQKGRTQQDESAKRKDYAYGKKLNNQKNYYYRFAGGG